MKRLVSSRLAAGLALLVLAGAPLACIEGNAAADDARPLLGPIEPLGNGAVESYALVDAAGTPQAVGVRFSADAFESLPQSTDGHRCYDQNGNGQIEAATECMPWYEAVLPLPTELTRRADMPFKWVLLNWNPRGHIPEGVWNTPHFDIHFYLAPIQQVFSLMPGPCGPEKIRCDQFDVATKPVPANYIHPDFQNVGAAAPAMGNHLVDPTGPAFHGQPFTRSWIYGAYDGEITFYEEMLSLDYLQSQPDDCFPIKTAEAVARSGYYPTTVCTRYHEATDEITVSMEDFVFREAAPPVPTDA